MHYIAIGTFARDSMITKEIMSRRRNYKYPDGFTNVQSYLDAQGGRVVIHFETDSAESILKYSVDWPELTFDIFAAVPSDTGWEIYLHAGN